MAPRSNTGMEDSAAMLVAQTDHHDVPEEFHDESPQSQQHQQQHHASVPQTVINMAKTCMGTGCLALPFAARQGGILLHVFGLVGLGIWNAITVHKLCQCHDIVTSIKQNNNDDESNGKQDDEALPLTSSSGGSSNFGNSGDNSHYGSLETPSSAKDRLSKTKPPKGMTTLVQLAWYAFGPIGAHLLDVIMVLYLIGVVVTYLNAMRSFLSDTPFSTGFGFVDSFFLVAIIGPLSVVPHTGHLAKASALGLLVLLATFVVIAWYGFVVGNEIDQTTWHVLTTGQDGSLTASTEATTSAQDDHRGSVWLPMEGMGGISQWFGVCVFGFGITPLAFTFQQAMREPERLVPATWWATLLVAGAYVVLGVGLLMPFPKIQGDVLHELPSAGCIPTITRVAMVLVVLVTAPLLIVPCGELVEGKIISVCHHQHLHNENDNNHRDNNEDWTFHKTPWWLKATVRWPICLLCAAISSFVPGFVNVLSFVGCCCVAVVGFCVPPFLHLILSIRFRHCGHRGTCNTSDSLACSIVADGVLLLWGFIATIVSTVYTFWELSSS